MKVVAPGKIILSGEHAVVYGNPALAVAVDQYVTTTISEEKLPGILFDFADLNHQAHINTKLLSALKQQIKNKYQRFKQGKISIKRVLKKPFELAQFAFGAVTETLNLSLPRGIKIHIQSELPIGCGMGSSGATIVSVMLAITQYLNKPLLNDELFKIALDAENMQHGASSGLDLRVALNGGHILFKQGEVFPRAIPNVSLGLINTGVPITTTGECVQQAAIFFRDQGLLDEFARVTYAMDHALQNDSSDLQAIIRHNHRLLARIGVVPRAVEQFILQLEELGTSAKICGAGAVRGDNAGMVMVVITDTEAIKSLCAKHGYSFSPLKIAIQGAHVI